MGDVPRITLVVDLTADGVTTGVLSPCPVGDGRIRIVVRGGEMGLRLLLPALEVQLYQDRGAGSTKPYHRSGNNTNTITS